MRIVSRDRTDGPAHGAYNICYLNAYQSQPQETSWWRTQHPGLLLGDRQGKDVGDPQWAGEVLFDTRTAGTRAALLRIIGPWIDGCARAGYAAVEPDNLDADTRSHGLLSRAGALAYARLLIARADQRGLAIAQKNTADLAPSGRRLGFDFAVAEQCQRYHECEAYSRAYGARVLEIEYSDDGRHIFDAACQARHGHASIVYRDRGPSRPGTPGDAQATC